MIVNGVDTSKRGRRLEYEESGAPIVMRANDGFGFDILQNSPGQVWCRNCLAQIPEDLIEAHSCMYWWEPNNAT